MKESSELYQRIVSDKNIFNAIYSIDSYVFEKGLLSEADSELLHKLADVYDQELVKETIQRCRIVLDDILLKGKCFEAKVYFKLKKEGDNSIPEYRPIHTSDLISQICMVCILQILMFDDTEDGRILSPLSMMIPHNFYGNIPSEDIRSLFHPWQQKYKQYQEDVMEKCREYKSNNKYSYEATLDLKDFFPSVHPGRLVDYLLESLFVPDDTDLADYRFVLERLLCIRLKNEEIIPWSNIYYGKTFSEDYSYTTKGIPQGLPQSYYFGNLVMLTVSKIISECIEGDAYYYVDDSVIYTNCDKAVFGDAIIKINDKLRKFEEERQSDFFGSVAQIRFQNKLDYHISVHEEGKSHLYDIGERMDTHFLYDLGEQISKTSQLFLNIDEIDEHASLEKLDSLIKVIERCLESLTAPDSDQQNDKKLLLRYKKYFRFRQSLLMLREDGEVNEDFVSRFNEKYFDNEFFQSYESDIFQTESRLIATNSSGTRLESFINSISSLERGMMHKADVIGGEDSLYFTKDLNGCDYLGIQKPDPYNTLRKCFAKQYKFKSTQKTDDKFDGLKLFWEDLQAGRLDFLPSYSGYVRQHSFYFSRIILNAYASWVFNVDINDSSILFKNNHRQLSLKEYRSLAVLRNKNTTKDVFSSFFNNILSEDDPLSKVEVSAALSEVMGIFFTDVGDPTYIDHLIRTHMVVTCLWKNGSKFMHAYTLHNEEHSVELIRQASRLARKIDYFTLKKLDFYILFLACYLHDISMVIHPDLDDFASNEIVTNEKVSRFLDAYKKIELDDSQYFPKMKHIMLLCFKEVFDYFETKIRSSHPGESAKFIRNRADAHFHYLESTVLELVAKVSESHGYDVKSVYGIKSAAKEELYSLKYMMILIRLADLMDITSSRVNYILLKENFKYMGETSRFHWISHYLTDSASLTPKYSIKTETDGLFNRPIIEDLVLELNMTLDCRQHRKKSGTCHGWSVSFRNVSGERFLYLTPPSSSSASIPCKEKKCDSMCYWVWLKNKYLFKELQELQHYLDQVNSSLVETRISIVVGLTNKASLNKELYDDVLSYVNSN